MKSLLSMTLLAALALAANAEAGEVYKWVDKDGNVHYSNTPPPEAAQRERQVLDESGRVTETLEAPMTPAEIEAERRRQAELAEQERLEKERAARDRMLLQTYTAVDEMEMARDGRIAALEAQVKVVSGTIASLEQQLAELDQRADTIRKAGNPVPEALEQQIETTRQELLDNQKFLLARQQEQNEIRKKFDADIARFKELKGIGRE